MRIQQPKEEQDGWEEATMMPRLATESDGNTN